MKRMTWDQMVSEYPDMWVAIKNPETDGVKPDILAGEVVTALSDDDVDDYEESHLDEKLIYKRTTESGWNGMFYTDFSITTV